jgi:hypothetical protein
MDFLHGATTFPITYTNDNLVKHLIWVDIILHVIYSCISILIWCMHLYSKTFLFLKFVQKKLLPGQFAVLLTPQSFDLNDRSK